VQSGREGVQLGFEGKHPVVTGTGTRTTDVIVVVMIVVVLVLV